MTNEEATNQLMIDLSQGLTVRDSLVRIGRSLSWYQERRRDDPTFKDRVDTIRVARGDHRSPQPSSGFTLADTDPKLLDFPTFSEKFLDQKVFPHMQNIVDLIDGREPSWMHPSFTYRKGEKDLLLVNVPPSHAKTSTITINYVVWRIVTDPSVRIVVVSKSQAMAKKMLLAIKNRLTHPQYAKLIAAYAPNGGFDENSDAWTTEMIYVGAGRDAEQKDPTVQAIGIRGHLYGARADLIVMDDCVDSTNTGEYEKQIDWIQSEVMSRIEADGALLVVGTRLAARDLYAELQVDERYPDGTSPWTSLTMPAVLEFHEDVEQWVTLWPRSNQPDERNAQPGPDGLYPKWDGPRLAKKRNRVTPRVWARVYQQQQTSEDTVFHPDDIRGCVLGTRRVGRIPAGMRGNRAAGMDGLIILGGCDPATSGFTAMTVLGLDPHDYRRYVLDVRNHAGLHPDQLRGLLFELTDRYGVTEWVIERNGFQGFLSSDTEVNQYMAARGCIVRPHFTGYQKHDPDFGVAAMSALFKGWKEGNNLIELPSPASSEGVKALIEQLGVWVPKPPKSQKTDTVMSLWFANLAADARVQAMSSFGRSHVRNPFLTKLDRSRQRVVNFEEIRRLASSGV